MRHLCYCAVMLLFAVVLLAEEVEKRQSLLEYYDALADEPSEDEIKALYELMARTASENKPAEVEESKRWLASNYPAMLGLPELTPDDYRKRTSVYLIDEYDEEHKVYRPPFKSFALRACLLRLLFESQHQKIDRFTYLVMGMMLLHDALPLPREDLKNPYIQSGLSYLRTEAMRLEELHKPQEHLLTLLKGLSANLDLAGEARIEKLQSFRTWMDGQQAELINAMIGYQWLSDNLSDDDIFKFEITNDYDIKRFKMPNARFDYSSFLSDIIKPGVLERTNEFLEWEYKKCNTTLSEQIIIYNIASRLWKKIIFGKGAEQVRMTAVSLLFVSRPCLWFPSVIQLYDKQVSEYRKFSASLQEKTEIYNQSSNRTLISKMSGESGPAWFYGEHSITGEKGIEEIKSDFVFPHVRMVHTDHVLSKSNFDNLFSYHKSILSMLLGRTGHILWHMQHHLWNEYTPNKEYEVDAKVHYSYDEVFLSELLSKDGDKLFRGTEGISRVSTNPRTVMAMFSPCVAYYYEKTKWEIFALADINKYGIVPYERPVAIVVISPLEGTRPTRVEPYLIPKPHDGYLWKTGIAPFFESNWMHTQCFKEDYAIEIIGKAEDIVNDLAKTGTERFHKHSRLMKINEYESLGKEPPPEVEPDQRDTLQRYNDIFMGDEEIVPIYKKMSDVPNQEDYQLLFSYLKDKYEMNNIRIRDVIKFYDDKDMSAPDSIIGYLTRYKLRHVMEPSSQTMFGITHPNITWRKYATHAAIIECVLHARTKLDKASDSYKALTALAYVHSRTMRMFAPDLLDEVHGRNYRWFLDKVSELDAKYGFVQQYSEMVEAEYENLGITGDTLSDRVRMWREKVNGISTPMKFSALLMWMFKNINKDDLLNADLPNPIPVEELKSIVYFVNKFGKLGQLGCDEISSTERRRFVGTRAEFLLSLRVLHHADEAIMAGEDVPFRRKCFSSAYELNMSSFKKVIGHSVPMMPSEFSEFIERTMTRDAECRLAESKAHSVRWEMLDSFESDGGWFASEEKAEGASGDWAPEKVHLYPSVAFVDHLGKLRNEDFDNQMSNMLADTGWVSKISGFSGDRYAPKIVHATPVKNINIPFDFRLCSVKQALAEKRLVESYPGLDELYTREYIGKNPKENEEAVSKGFIPCFWFQMPRSKWVVWRQYKYADIELERPLGKGVLVVSVSPIEGDSPIAARSDMVKRCAAYTWKMGFSRDMPKPFNYPEIFESATLRSVYDQYSGVLKKDYEDMFEYNRNRQHNERNLKLWGNAHGVPYDVD